MIFLLWWWNRVPNRIILPAWRMNGCEKQRLTEMTLPLATASSGTSYPLPCFLCFFTGGHTPRQIPRYPQSSIRIPIIPVSCLHGRCSSSRTASAHPPRPHWSSDSELSTDPSRVIDHGHNGHNGHNGCGFKSTKIYYPKRLMKGFELVLYLLQPA